ncbi:TonB-dependent receptor [Steroidobacter sp. S1-65]|uniref:TonB-dependent receptor n=1 Tax=Steroidobacter gossypii TaxID=2805490 RepID=A0ABS1WW30_9GAMM|nr:TonB-dependent receptor [Steroidobacter gossypii]MBM0105180.1 TonB-dependent receptor [Steroidobacter gossypii]
MRARQRIVYGSRIASFTGGGLIVLAAAAPSEVLAAQALEEVVVTGIRGSLSESAEIKHSSNSILDSISSEDLGKFPDSNVAESLQRIPGVAIDRSDGEGRFVTVRGFGPEFNNVLLNGRTFASDNEGREFSFDLLAAELIAGADIYKSAVASVPDGGIGATINVRTPRPLDLGGFNAIVSGKGMYEEVSEDVAPQGFALLSDVFADGKFGILGAVSYQERKSLINFIRNSGYLPRSIVGPPSAPLFTNVFAPRNLDVGQETQDRKRRGVNITAQYRPADDLTLTLDGLYNKFDVESSMRSLGSWFEPSNYTAATIDDNRTVTSLTTNGNADFIAEADNRYVTTRALGFNMEWQASDAIGLDADVAWSESENDAGGKNYFTVIGVATPYSFTQASGSGFPSVFGYSSSLTDPNVGRTHLAQRSGDDQREQVVESKLKLEWSPEGDFLEAARIGALLTRREKETRSIATDGNITCLYCGYPTLTDPGLLRPLDLGSFLGGGGSVPKRFQTYDPEAYFAFLESAQAAAALDAARGVAPGTSAAALAQAGGFVAVPQSSSYSIDEDVLAGFVEFDFGGTLGSMPWFLNLGVRYSRTEIDAAGQQLELIDILPVAGDPTIYQGVFANDGDPQPTRRSSSYNDVLPSLNFKLELTPEIVGRFSASRTLSRPQVQDLAPRTNIDTLRPASLAASGGNPDLKPYTADNYDVSLEWYPDRTTMLSAALFYKDVKDFIVQTRADETFTIINSGNLPVGGLITGPNEARFSVRRPRNLDNATVRGAELNLVYSFTNLPGWLSGFGTQLNATFVESNVAFAPESDTVSFALEGLGDSRNATLFYEYQRIGVRVAYNWRDGFLEQLVTSGQGGDPVYRRTYEQMDLRLSFMLTDQVQTFLEGTNVLGEEIITTGRFDNQVLSYIDTGARWALGLRATF